MTRLWPSGSVLYLDGAGVFPVALLDVIEVEADAVDLDVLINEVTAFTGGGYVFPG